MIYTFIYLVVMYLSVIIFWLKGIQILTNSLERNFVVKLFCDNWMITVSDPSQAITNFYNSFEPECYDSPKYTLLL